MAHPLAAQPRMQAELVAGTAETGDGGSARHALLLQAEGVAVDHSGNLYVSDAAGHRIRKITPGGIITTVAGTGRPGFSGDEGLATRAQLNTPYGLAFDAAGNLYVADLGNHRVRRIHRDGTIETIAGGGELPMIGGTEGLPATEIALETPRGLAFDSSHNLLIADSDAHRVFRVAPGGSLHTFAGTGTSGFAPDGEFASRAALFHPSAVAVGRNLAGSRDVIYIADTQNHRVRTVENGILGTLAEVAAPTGLAMDPWGVVNVADAFGGEILRLPLEGPPEPLGAAGRDLAFAPDGTMYFANGPFVHRRSSSGDISLFAGGGSSASGDHGPGVAARLNQPTGVAIDPAGNLYIADRDNHRIRRVAPDGIITTVSGTGMAGNGGDGGPATRASLNRPESVGVDVAGNLYISDTGNGRVRVVTPGGVMLPVAATPSPLATLASDSGTLYVTDDSLGQILQTTAAPAPGKDTLQTLRPLSGSSSAGLVAPSALAMDADGVLYLADSDAARVRRIKSDGSGGGQEDLAPGFWFSPRGIAISPPGSPEEGTLYVADPGRRQLIRIATPASPESLPEVVEIDFPAPVESHEEPEEGTQLLLSPWAVTIASDGAIYLADPGTNQVWRLSPALEPPPIRHPELLHAATREAGPVAPGMLTILTGVPGDLRADEVDRLQVWFGDYPATILAANASADDPDILAELVVSTPPELTVLPQAAVFLKSDFDAEPQFLLSTPVVPAAPALFTNSDVVEAAGSQALQAVALNQDGSLNGADSPASRGSIIVLYGTGQGVEDLPVTVYIAGLAAEVLYTGPVAANPGLWQLNVRIPTGFVPTGPLTVRVKVASNESPAGVVIHVN